MIAPFKIPLEKPARFCILPTENIRSTFCTLVYNFDVKQIQAIVADTYLRQLLVAKILSFEQDADKYVFWVQYSRSQLGDFTLFTNQRMTVEETKEVYTYTKNNKEKL